MKQQLFQYAVLWHPNNEQIKTGIKSKMIIEPKWLMAKDEGTVKLTVSREIPVELVGELDQVEILITSF